MKKLWCAIYLVAASVAFSQPAEIILIRHAEKPVDPNDNHLSAMGQERAKALPILFTHQTEFTTNGRPVAFFAARPERHMSMRAVETLRPTARRLQRTLQAPYIAQDVHKLAKAILHRRGYKGKTVLIAWTHDFLPALAEEFGVQNAPVWDSNTFDRVWVITYEGSTAVLRDLPQNLLPGDSTN